MSFLDNLESNLKSLESHDEHVRSRDRDRPRREAEQARAAATAPFTEQLRRGPFTAELLTEATRLGHSLRTKVYMTWIDSVLRLDAREHRLELKATPEGVVALFYVNKQLGGEEVVDLNGSAKQLAERWLSGVTSHPGGR
jgi:hypothetical protein